MTIRFASGDRCPGPRFAILLPLLLLAVLSGCKGDGLNDFEREKNKKEANMGSLRDQGAKITQKDYGRQRHGYVVDLRGAQLTDSTFQLLKNLQRVSELDLSNSSLTDDQMDKLNGVAYVLVNLDLSNTAVTDAGLEKLTNLNLCFHLNLTGTKVTPAGVERFKEQRLARRSTRVKDMKVQLK